MKNLGRRYAKLIKKNLWRHYSYLTKT